MLFRKASAILLALTVAGCAAQDNASNAVSKHTVDPIAQARMLIWVRSMQMCGAQFDGVYTNCANALTQIPADQGPKLSPPVVKVSPTGYSITINHRAGASYSASSTNNAYVDFTCVGDALGCTNGKWGGSAAG